MFINNFVNDYFFNNFKGDPIYTSEKHGSDEHGNGTEEKPFKSILQAMRHAGKEPFPNIYQDSQKDGEKYELAAKSQLKKVHKLWVREKYKKEETEKKLKDDEEKRLKNLEEAKSIIIEEDKSLPAAVKIKIQQAVDHRDKRIKISGWVHRLRKQGAFLQNIIISFLNKKVFQFFAFQENL